METRISKSESKMKKLRARERERDGKIAGKNGRKIKKERNMEKEQTNGPKPTAK